MLLLLYINMIQQNGRFCSKLVWRRASQEFDGTVWGRTGRALSGRPKLGYNYPMRNQFTRLWMGLALMLLVTGLSGCTRSKTPTEPAATPVTPSASPTARPTTRPDSPTVRLSPAATASTEPAEPAATDDASEIEQPPYQLMLPAVVNIRPSETPTPFPTAIVTPEPTPTPRWPEPLAEPGPSKLGLHVVRNDDPFIMEFVRRVRPAVVKAVGDVGWLSEVKQVSPETVTIGRLQATHQDMNGDPALAAQAFVAEQLARYLLNPGVDYWEGWNEPDPNENMPWYAAFEAERIKVMAQHGLKTAVGGFAAGVPEWDEFLNFVPAIQAAQQYGGILTLHEYGAPTVDYLVGTPLPGWPGYADRGVLALRYRWWYEEILKPRGLVVPLVISEAGIDGILMPGERPGPHGLGWREFSDYWSQIGLEGGPQGYIRQLAWYDGELRRDDFVIGFTVFTAGGAGGWDTYDINDILPEIAVYVAEQAR